MGISHKWNGTVLTITSDSGTSSCDLKGEKGDTGVRGAQGRCGITLTPDGVIDTTGLATEEYVEERLATFDASASAITGSAMGASILLDDVSATNQKAEITVESRNLFNGITNNPSNSLDVNNYREIDLSHLERGQYTLCFTDVVYLQAHGGISVPKQTVSKQCYVFNITYPSKAFVRFRSDNGIAAWADAGIDVALYRGSVSTVTYTPYVEDLSSVTVSRSGRNLYTLEGRTQVDLGANANTTPRTFTGNGYFYPYTANNYFKPSREIAHSFDAEKGEITYTPEYASYGIGIDIAVEPNTKYLIKADYYGSTNAKLTYGLYDSDGVWLSFAQITSSAIVTTPANAKWMTVVVISSTDNTAVNVGGIQVIKTSADVTDFEAAIEPQEFIVSADGQVINGSALYPSTYLTTNDTTNVVLKIKYQRDADYVYNELRNAVLSMGGNV